MATTNGVLGQVQISDILRVINTSKKTGIMRMTSKDGSVAGFLYIHQGEIIHATCGDAEGEDAAFLLLALDLDPGGKFSFDSPNAAASLKPRTIHQPCEFLVVESRKVHDTRRRVKALFPDPKAVPYLTGDPKQKGVKLHDEEKTVISAINGRLDFTEITTATGINSLLVLQTAAMLKDADAIATVSPLAKGTAKRRRSFILKSKQAVLPAKLEAFWKAMPPYAKDPLKNLCVITASGKRHELKNVQFDPKLKADEFFFPEDQLAQFGLAEGEEVWLKPA